MTTPVELYHHILENFLSPEKISRRTQAVLSTSTRLQGDPLPPGGAQQKGYQPTPLEFFHHLRVID